MTTHYPECWRDPKHHGCAVAILVSAHESLQQIRKHAAQGQVDPRFAKDQCWEIECATIVALHRIGIKETEPGKTA